MSDLTPPRSQQNTPVRPGETPAQSSPSASRAPRPPHGNGRFEPSAYRGLGTLPDRLQPPAGRPNQREQADDDEHDEDEDEDEDEDGVDIDDDEDERMIMMDEDGEEMLKLTEDVEDDEDENMGEALAEQPGQGNPAAPAASQTGEGSSTTPAKRTVRGMPKAKPRATGNSRRDNELYESDVVARWHAEIGDVCVKPPRQARTGA